MVAEINSWLFYGRLISFWRYDDHRVIQRKRYHREGHTTGRRNRFNVVFNDGVM
jgi:hypothetical protein